MSAKTTAENSKWTEDWLPLKQIQNGMAITDDGYYVSGVKVSPRNIFILDSGLQNSILTQLSNFYNTIDYEFWLLIADRPVDIDLYLSKLLVQYNNPNTNNFIKKMIMQDINKANMFTSNAYNIVDTEYFLMFKDKKMDVVQKRINQSITGLASAGLNSCQTSNNDLRMILDNFLNDGDTTTLKAVI